ncbi:MAG: response regulator transcription factor [Verrucomicrobia bacterium]|nr:response regulator transcription factor [Verrucomicrobiota bacterium]
MKIKKLPVSPVFSARQARKAIGIEEPVSKGRPGHPDLDDFSEQAEPVGNPGKPPADLAGTRQVLVVADDLRTAETLAGALRGVGFPVQFPSATLPRHAAISAQLCEVIIVDLGGGRNAGPGLVKRLRESGDDRPVLLICREGGSAGRVRGMEAGADDCLTWPYEFQELNLRVQRLLRAPRSVVPLVLQVRDLILHTMSRTVHRGGRHLELTKCEFRLLEFLMRSAGRVCSRETISREVWDGELTLDSNLIEVYVQKLRTKIEVGMEPKLLHSVRGVGYVVRCDLHARCIRDCSFQTCAARGS